MARGRAPWLGIGVVGTATKSTWEGRRGREGVVGGGRRDLEKVRQVTWVRSETSVLASSPAAAAVLLHHLAARHARDVRPDHFAKANCQAAASCSTGRSRIASEWATRIRSIGSDINAAKDSRKSGPGLVCMRTSGGALKVPY